MGAKRISPLGCSRRTEWVVFGLVLIVIGALSFVPVLTPPIRGDVQASVDVVRGHIEAIAIEPHPMGTPEIERVRSYLIGTLAEAGITAETQAVEVPDYFGTAPGSSVEVVNVMARIPGTSSSGAVLFVAHYDTDLFTPGANDNSMAVGNLLEVARELEEGAPLANDVIVLFTDGEEPAPRFGASAFMDHPWADDVAVVFNLEAVGESGPSLLVEELGGNRVTRGYAGAVDEPAAFSFMTQTAELIGGASSDFDVFGEAGIPGLVFATLRGSAIYHTPNDSVDNVHDEVIAHQGTTALALARSFGDADLTDLDDGDFDVFFTVLRNVMVYHPPWWLAVVLVASLAGLVAVVALRWGEEALTGRALLVDTLATLLAALAAIVVSSLLWTLIVALFPTMGAAASYVGLASIAVVIGAIALSLMWLRAGARGPDSVDVAVLVAWLSIAALVFLGAPRASYVFVWPCLAGIVAALTMPWWRSRWAWVIGSSIVAFPAMVLVNPMVDTFFLIAGPRPGNVGSELPYVIAVSALCLFLVIMLIGATALAGVRRSADTKCSCPPATHVSDPSTNADTAAAGSP